MFPQKRVSIHHLTLGLRTAPLERSRYIYIYYIQIYRINFSFIVENELWTDLHNEVGDWAMAWSKPSRMYLSS